jgi:hypothetical protein
LPSGTSHEEHAASPCLESPESQGIIPWIKMDNNIRIILYFVSVNKPL